jgi:hypothetical protein
MSRNDERLMAEFHQAPWRERFGLAQVFEDARYCEFSERIIFAGRPE